MPRTQFLKFNGIMPKISPRNLPDMSGQTAKNCWLSESTLEPIHAPSVIQAIAAAQTSLYLWRRGSAEEWLTWAEDVNVVQGPIADDQYDRIYWTDGTTLHMNLWTGAAKVTVHDVSKAVPSAPTIAKGVVFDPAGMSMYWRDSVTGHRTAYNLNYKGFRWNEELLIVDFYMTAADIAAAFIVAGGVGAGSNSAAGVLHITVPTTGMTVVQAGTATASDHVPFDTMELDQSKMYVNQLDMTKTGAASKFSTFQVIGYEWVEDPNDVAYATVGATTTTVHGATVSVTIKMNYARSITQYQYYVAATVDGYGQESPCSVPSERVEWGPNDTLTLTVGGSGIRRVYRSATGKVDDPWLFLTQLADGTTTYADSLTDSQLSETMPNIENPPTLMTGLVALPGGFLAAFHGHDLYFSEPFTPYSWPTEYRQTLDIAIVGLAVSGNDLVVLTEGCPYIVSGSHPEMLRASKLSAEQSCTSKRSIAFADGFVLYASPDGLCAVTGGNIRVVTDAFYTRDQWQALGNTTMIGSVHDRRYVGWLASGAIVFDFSEQAGRLTTTDQTATGAWSDPLTDGLYIIQGASINKWRGATTHLTVVWRSKMWQTIRDAMWNTAIVIATSYNSLTFRLYADGVLVATHVVLNNNAFRLPKLSRCQMWEMELETTDVIHETVMSSSMAELRAPNPMSPIH
jgi:hypothetical protein